jgi:hypothetical protein
MNRALFGVHAAQKHRSGPRMVGAGIGTHAAGGGMRQVGHNRNAIPEFLERARISVDSKPLPSAAGVHLSMVAPWGT